VFSLLAAYRGMLARTDCLYGCPIGSLALELHEPDPPVRELIAINFDGWVAAIERCFAEAGARLPADLDRHALAVFTLTTMEGGVMQSRTQRNLAAFDQSIAMLRDYVRRLETMRETKNFKGGKTMKRQLLCCALAMCWSSPPGRRSDAVAAKDTSFRDADGHRVQQVTVIVGAPVKDGLGCVHHRCGFREMGGAGRACHARQ
jgi:hypothetical protein